jgi:hypothetical protein
MPQMLPPLDEPPSMSAAAGMQNPCMQSESILHAAPGAPAVAGITVGIAVMVCIGLVVGVGVGVVERLGRRVAMRDVMELVELIGLDRVVAAWHAPATQVIPALAQGSTSWFTSQRIGSPLVSTIALHPQHATAKAKQQTEALLRNPTGTRSRGYPNQRDGQRNNA